MRIAYVEDNLTNQSLVHRVAGMNGHTVTSYSEGEIALKELIVHKFDLILMDIELAGEVNGLQVVRTLRSHGLTTPIVAVTAYAMMGDREKCLEAGCNDYLPKPLPIAEFLVLLAHYDSALHDPQTASEGTSANPVSVVGPESPIVTHMAVVNSTANIVEPHADPITANEQALSVRGDTAPLPDLSGMTVVKPGVGQPGVPAHAPAAADAKVAESKIAEPKADKTELAESTVKVEPAKVDPGAQPAAEKTVAKSSETSEEPRQSEAAEIRAAVPSNAETSSPSTSKPTAL